MRLNRIAALGVVLALSVGMLVFVGAGQQALLTRSTVVSTIQQAFGPTLTASEGTLFSPDQAVYFSGETSTFALVPPAAPDFERIEQSLIEQIVDGVQREVIVGKLLISEPTEADSVDGMSRVTLPAGVYSLKVVDASQGSALLVNEGGEAMASMSLEVSVVPATRERVAAGPGAHPTIVEANESGWEVRMGPNCIATACAIVIAAWINFRK